MTRTIAAAALILALPVCWITPAIAEAAAPPAKTEEQPKLPGTEEAPGFEDFEKGDVSPEDVREEQEREDDRNVISPSMQDGEPLPGMDVD